MIIISFGPNNSSGLSPNQNGYIACQSEARHAYQSYVPHYPLSFGQGDTLISQSFNIGRIKFILTDLRSEKRRPLFAGDCEMPDATDCEKNLIVVTHVLKPILKLLARMAPSKSFN